jgi:signal transduction histidine kinase
MTLKFRLAMMMVIILMAVMILQYLLMQKEQQDLLDRLEELSSGLDQSTLVFVQRAHELARKSNLPNLDSLLEEFQEDGEFHAAESPAKVEILVWSDNGASHDSITIEAEANLNPNRKLIFQLDTLRYAPDETLAAGFPPTALESVHVRNVELTAQENESLHVVGRLPFGSRAGFYRTAGGGKNEQDIVINLPLSVAESESAFYSLQYRYPINHLTEELARSRRRGLYWLIAILAVGILGAFLVAVQFTRPIKTLQASFGRVVDGDLDAEIAPRRSDEIGKLTGSFNEMVGRLKESQQVEKRLAEAERLAAVGRLAAGVAHEVRNPLNAILLTMQQMRDKVRGADDGGPPETGRQGNGEFSRYYNLVTSEISRLEKLVGAFLDFSKSGDLHIETVDAGESLRASVALFRPEAENAGVSLQLDCPAGLSFEADPARLPMVWNNLLSNALEATPSGKKVIVQAGIEGEDLIVAVSDEGGGIASADLPRIWEPFYSGRPGGTGLGLSIVRSVVEHHGGRVQAASGENGRTRITVAFPRHQKDRAAAAIEAQAEGEPPA